jgi:transposase
MGVAMSKKTRVTKAKEHLSLDEIDAKIKTVVGFWRVQRWMVIRHALVAPRPASEIAKVVGVATQTVHNLISAYNKKGIEAVEVQGRGQRQRAYLSKEEEKEFLFSFEKKALQGELTTVSEIKEALENKLEQEVDLSTVYRLLHRNGWGKKVPRQYNPKNKDSEQEAFKKSATGKSRKTSRRK